MTKQPHLAEHELTEAELEGYLDEALDSERMAQIEQTLRARPEILHRLVDINSRRDCGIHTLAEIWRRHQIGVPTRDELQRFLAGSLPKEHAAYIRFRLDVLQCRYTVANLRDLESERRESQPQVQARRHKIFQSSVGHLRD